MSGLHQTRCKPDYVFTISVAQKPTRHLAKTPSRQIKILPHLIHKSFYQAKNWWLGVFSGAHKKRRG